MPFMKCCKAYPKQKYPAQGAEKQGVLLVNLGTPENTGYFALRRYLKQFLSDKRVIDKCPFWWKPLLNCLLLQIIPFRSAKNYEAIWDKKHNASPLRVITKEQAKALQKQVDNNTIVDWAFTYGSPSVDSVIKKMTAKGCTSIKILPLYPQYSSSTTGSVYDSVANAIKTMRNVPAIEFIQPFYDNKDYINALKDSVLKALEGKQVDALVFSYHGLPMDYIKKGDPYSYMCEQTTKLLAKELKMPENTVFHSYQSRFGRGEWLTPNVIDITNKLAKDGKKNIAVITPSFISDCVETLFEIDIQLKEHFKNAGGKSLTLIPCLNSSKECINLLKNLSK